MRHDFQRMMTKSLTDTFEELTGRNVVAFLSQAHVEPDITMEIFFVDGPLESLGAVEITETEWASRLRETDESEYFVAAGPRPLFCGPNHKYRELSRAGLRDAVVSRSCCA